VALTLKRAAAENRASQLELEAVEAAARETIAWHLAEIERLKTLGRLEGERWDGIHLSLDTFATTKVTGDIDGFLDALSQITRALGGKPDFESMDDLEAFMASRQTLDLRSKAGAREVESRSSALAAACADLGPISRKGLGSPTATDLTLLQTLLRGAQVTRPYVGTHVAADRHVASNRLKYWHHGLMISESELVHFSGEPGQPFSRASIELVDWEAFAKGSSKFVSRTPDQFRDKPIAALHRNMSAFRALQRMGETGYSLTSNNCEHFSMWAQLGTDYSHQARTYKRKVIRNDEVASIDKLEGIFTCSVKAFEPPAPNSSSPKLALDLGRAYADLDSGRAAVWVPVWDIEDERAPAVGAERPWSDSFGRTWGERPRFGPERTSFVEPIAALVWFETTGPVWLTAEGVVRETKFNLFEACEERIGPSRVALKAWLDQPHSQALAHLLADKAIEFIQ